MRRITNDDIGGLVRSINGSFLSRHYTGLKEGGVLEMLDKVENHTIDKYTVDGLFHLRGLDLYRNGEQEYVRHDSRCILRASTKRELFQKLSAFIEGMMEAHRDK